MRIGIYLDRAIRLLPYPQRFQAQSLTIGAPTSCKHHLVKRGCFAIAIGNQKALLSFFDRCNIPVEAQINSAQQYLRGQMVADLVIKAA